MKKLILGMITLICGYTVNAQEILIVDNNLSEPLAQNYYTDLQLAVTESSSGDVIHVMPSPNDYGQVTIDGKSNISLIGVGMNPKFNGEDNIHRSVIDSVIIHNSSSIVLKGLWIDNFDTKAEAVSDDGTTSNNLLIESCVFFGVEIGDVTDTLIRGALFDYRNGAGRIDIWATANNVEIINSIIEQSFVNVSNTTFKNNLFRKLREYPMQYCWSCVFSNNIFLGYDQIGQFSTFLENSLFTYNYFDDPEYVFPNSAGYNITSSNNLTSELSGTVFHNEKIDGSLTLDFNLSWELVLTATELTNAGSDGTDIGPTGGRFSYKFDRSPLPYIYSADVPFDVKEGEDIEVTIKAKGN